VAPVYVLIVLEVLMAGLGWLREPFCIIISDFVNIGQTVAEISRFFVVFKTAAASILDFQKFEILTASPL